MMNDKGKKTASLEMCEASCIFLLQRQFWRELRSIFDIQDRKGKDRDTGYRKNDKSGVVSKIDAVSV
jgi:hypothetical protein